MAYSTDNPSQYGTDNTAQQVGGGQTDNIWNSVAANTWSNFSDLRSLDSRGAGGRGNDPNSGRGTEGFNFGDNKDGQGQFLNFDGDIYGTSTDDQGSDQGNNDRVDLLALNKELLNGFEGHPGAGQQEGSWLDGLFGEGDLFGEEEEACEQEAEAEAEEQADDARDHSVVDGAISGALARSNASSAGQIEELKSLLVGVLGEAVRENNSFLAAAASSGLATVAAAQATAAAEAARNMVAQVKPSDLKPGRQSGFFSAGENA